MSEETNQPSHCERCHKETPHLIRFMEHYICSSCLYREDKRINLKSDWKREGQRRRVSSKQ